MINWQVMKEEIFDFGLFSNLFKIIRFKITFFNFLFLMVVSFFILRVFQKWEFLEFRTNRFKLGYADTECEVY
jgi:hypothetical protein